MLEKIIFMNHIFPCSICYKQKQTKRLCNKEFQVIRIGLRLFGYLSEILVQCTPILLQCSSVEVNNNICSLHNIAVIQLKLVLNTNQLINQCSTKINITGLGLWCLTQLSTIFQLYRGVQFYFVEETGGPGENHRPVASH